MFDISYVGLIPSSAGVNTEMDKFSMRLCSSHTLCSGVKTIYGIFYSQSNYYLSASLITAIGANSKIKCRNRQMNPSFDACVLKRKIRQSEHFSFAVMKAHIFLIICPWYFKYQMLYSVLWTMNIEIYIGPNFRLLLAKMSKCTSVQSTSVGTLPR